MGLIGSSTVLTFSKIFHSEFLISDEVDVGGRNNLGFITS